MLYQLRTTAFDELLLRHVFPWVESMHIAPLRLIVPAWLHPVTESK